MGPFEHYLLIFLLSMVAADLLTPLAGKLALRFGAVDKPSARKVHTHPIPLLGGLAIYIGFFLGASLVVALNSQMMLALFFSSSFIVFVGILDDLYDLKPIVKLSGQLAAAVIFVACGMQIQFVTNPWGGMFYLGIWGIPITILWLVAMSNVVNFLDGLDGLAAGVSTIASLAVFIVAVMRGQYLVAGITMALMGSAMGFLRHNFNPARIFMGDSGAMFLGFTLAAIAVQGSLKGAMTLGLVVPALAFGVPIVDTAFAIIRRKRRGVPISQADRGHIHHRLLDRGFSQKQAVILIYLLTACLGIVGVGLAAGSSPMVIGAISLGALLLHLSIKRNHLEG